MQGFNCHLKESSIDILHRCILLYWSVYPKIETCMQSCLFFIRMYPDWIRVFLLIFVDPNNCSCHECTHWKKTGGRMIRWYACTLLLIRPAHFYYCFTLDYNYSDMLMYFVNFLSFLYLFLKTKTLMSKQKYGENKGKTMSSVVQLNSCCETWEIPGRFVQL